MRQGFTLIELMVIVAIIGLFIAIALASLGGSKNKGSDATVKQDLRALQQQADLYSLYHGNVYGLTYGESCDAVDTLFDDTAIVRGIAAIRSAAGPASVVTCGNSVTAYAVSSSLTGGGFWCVDSGGFSGAIETNIAAGDTSCR